MLNEDKDLIIERISKSDHLQHEKDFLLLNLKFLLSNSSQTDLVNDEADKFLKSYRGSPYESFVRIYIRHIYAPKKWRFGVEFFSGYGVFSGSLAGHYTNSVPFGVDFDICYKNLTLYIRDYIGFSHTKHEFNDKGAVWEKQSQVRVYLPEASIGYNFLRSKHFRLSPFAGIASTDIAPTSYDLDHEEGLDKYDMTFTTTWVTGINFDFLLGRQDPLKGGTFFLRLRYAYTFPQFGRYNEGFDGNMQYITLGIGCLAWKAKREY